MSSLPMVGEQRSAPGEQVAAPGSRPARRSTRGQALVVFGLLAMGRLLLQAGWAVELPWSTTEQLALECPPWSTRGSSSTGCSAPGLAGELLLLFDGDGNGDTPVWGRAPAVIAAPVALLLVVLWVALLGGGLRARLVAAVAVLAVPAGFRLHASASAVAIQAVVALALLVAATLGARRLDRLPSSRRAVGLVAGGLAAAAAGAFGLDPLLVLALLFLGCASPWRSAGHRVAALVGGVVGAFSAHHAPRVGRTFWEGGELDGADGVAWRGHQQAASTEMGFAESVLELNPAVLLLTLAGLSTLLSRRAWRPALLGALALAVVAAGREASPTRWAAWLLPLVALAAVGLEPWLASGGRPRLWTLLALLIVAGGVGVWLLI